jgi:hypothetical protein
VNSSSAHARRLPPAMAKKKVFHGQIQAAHQRRLGLGYGF